MLSCVAGCGVEDSESSAEEQSFPEGAIHGGIDDLSRDSTGSMKTLAPAISNSKSRQIPHDKVKHLANNAPDFAHNYKPRLAVNGGCVPFPAVQSDGSWSGGLKSSGAENGSCSRNVGQIYTRYKYLSDRDECALMYSWYFPKDGNFFAGHRHDWEAVVVWLKGSCAIQGEPIAVAYSTHGGWSVRKGSAIPLHDGTGTKIQPKVKYWKSTLFTNYELGPTSELGGDQPLVSWLNLTDAARWTLNGADFGKAIVPFKDSKFDDNIVAAKHW